MTSRCYNVKEQGWVAAIKARRQMCKMDRRQPQSSRAREYVTGRMQPQHMMWKCLLYDR